MLKFKNNEGFLCAFLAFCICLPCMAQEATTFPFAVYRDVNQWGNLDGNGAPSGWMGDYADVSMNLQCKDNPYSGETCIQVNYQPGAGIINENYWAGVMWQHPPNNVGLVDGGVNLKGAKKLTFWARGAEGGEIIDSFKIGGTLGYYPDSDATAIFNIRLTTEWQQFEIDLEGLDMTYISSFFSWVANRHLNPWGFTIYLDDIIIEDKKESRDQED